MCKWFRMQRETQNDRKKVEEKEREQDKTEEYREKQTKLGFVTVEASGHRRALCVTHQHTAYEIALSVCVCVSFPHQHRDIHSDM